MTRQEKLMTESPLKNLKRPNRSKPKNMGLLSFVGLTTVACNASEDDQCYGGLGILIGSICAISNDAVVNNEVKLTNITSTDDFILNIGLDTEGKKISDTVEFKNKSNVIGTKYTLTEGDILKSPGKVFRRRWSVKRTRQSLMSFNFCFDRT